MKKLVVFTQALEDCVFCKRFHPVVEKLIEDGYDVTVHQAFDKDGNHNPLNAEWNVRSTPTSIVLDENDQEVTRFLSARPYKYVSELLGD